MPKSKAEEQRRWIEQNVCDVKAASEYLGISRWALYQAVNYGRIERTANGFFLKSDLDELKANSRRIGKTEKIKNGEPVLTPKTTPKTVPKRVPLHNETQM